MKKFLTFIIILVIGFFLGSYYMENYSPKKEEPTTEVAETAETVNQEKTQNDIEEENFSSLPDPVDIYVDFSVSVNSDNSFTIKTNLPDQTELSLTLEGRGYIAQGEAVVENGIALSPAFSNNGKRLEGPFELEVMMPIPNVQNDYVKHFIGDRGQYLKGDYIKAAMGSVVVIKSFNVTLLGE